jgi:hypothetical protein
MTPVHVNQTRAHGSRGHHLQTTSTSLVITVDQVCGPRRDMMTSGYRTIHLPVTRPASFIGLSASSVHRGSTLARGLHWRVGLLRSQLNPPPRHRNKSNLANSRKPTGHHEDIQLIWQLPKWIQHSFRYTLFR